MSANNVLVCVEHNGLFYAWDTTAEEVMTDDKDFGRILRLEDAIFKAPDSMKERDFIRHAEDNSHLGYTEYGPEWVDKDGTWSLGIVAEMAVKSIDKKIDKLEKERDETQKELDTMIDDCGDEIEIPEGDVYLKLLHLGHVMGEMVKTFQLGMETLIKLNQIDDKDRQNDFDEIMRRFDRLEQKKITIGIEHGEEEHDEPDLDDDDHGCDDDHDHDDEEETLVEEAEGACRNCDMEDCLLYHGLCVRCKLMESNPARGACKKCGRQPRLLYSQLCAACNNWDNSDFDD